MSYTLPEAYDSVFWEGKLVDVFRPEQLQAAFEAGRASRDAEVEELKADLKHTEECCVLWATDYGNALKEVEALKADASTARTYMDGYSDGKAWALEEAAKVALNGIGLTTVSTVDRIRKLGEGL